MKFVSSLAIAAVVAVTGSQAFAAGGILDGKGKVKAMELVGTAATGDAKPYTARVETVCKKGVCRADFGQKRNQNRGVEFINCGVRTENGIARVGAVALDDIDNQLGYLSTVSRATDGSSETAVLEYQNPVTATARTRLLVAIEVTGKATAGQCTIGGTIE